MSELTFRENEVLNVQGFISAYTHKQPLEFVRNGSEEKQGYFRRPEVIENEMHVKNLIVDGASQLMAKRMRPGASWGQGITHLELGTGLGTGTTQAPEGETVDRNALREPLARKVITSWTYADVNGQPTANETNVLLLTTTFETEEANGAIVEMGLFGGEAADELGSGTMFNYKTFPVWNKRSGMFLTIIWKLTF